MSIITDFIEQYERNKEQYEQVRLIASKMLDDSLRDSGIMAITSSRVKDSNRLKEKLFIRQKENHYSSIEDIKKDIVDLVGVRVSLYFPDDLKKVDSIVKQLFVVEKIKQFPAEQRKNNVYSRRFSGYCATHYRVYLKKKNEELANNIRIEIQVASLLMHAWSEVEHDLTYKQKKGLVSFDEYESLDEINGLVIAGEISLQRLQRITELRMMNETKPFANHYLLATYIYNSVEEKTNSEIILGDVETLYLVLKERKRLTPQKVQNDLKKIDLTDATPIAQQLIDLYADDSYNVSKLVIKAKDEKSDARHVDKRYDAVVGEFLRCWIALERTINDLRNERKRSFKSHETTRFLKTNELLPESLINEYGYLRRVRNELVHGGERIETEKLRKCIDAINTINNELRKIETPV